MTLLLQLLSELFNGTKMGFFLVQNTLSLACPWQVLWDSFWSILWAKYQKIDYIIFSFFYLLFQKNRIESTDWGTIKCKLYTLHNKLFVWEKYLLTDSLMFLVCCKYEIKYYLLVVCVYVWFQCFWVSPL